MNDERSLFTRQTRNAGPHTDLPLIKYISELHWRRRVQNLLYFFNYFLATKTPSSSTLEEKAEMRK